MANGRHNGRSMGDTMANRYLGDTMAWETQWRVTHVLEILGGYALCVAAAISISFL